MADLKTAVDRLVAGYALGTAYDAAERLRFSARMEAETAINEAADVARRFPVLSSLASGAAIACARFVAVDEHARNRNVEAMVGDVSLPGPGCLHLQPIPPGQYVAVLLVLPVGDERGGGER